MSKKSELEIAELKAENQKLKEELYDEMLSSRGITYCSGNPNETIDKKIQILKLLDEEGLTENVADGIFKAICDIPEGITNMEEG